MSDRRTDLHPDVLVGGGAEPEVEDARPSPGRARGLAALLVAAGVGFAAAQVVSPSPSDGATGGTGASLALVTGRQPALEGSPFEQTPKTGMEVTLVNTGPDALRLDTAELAGSGLRWDVDRPLKPGQQAVAMLRDDSPCDGPLDGLSGGGRARQLRVRTLDEQTGDRLPDALLPLPPTVGPLYDDHVRTTCALPRLAQAVEITSSAPEPDGEESVVPLGLLSRSVRPVQVVEVEVTVPDVTARLTSADGRPVPLPLTLPARTRTQIAEGVPYGDPGSMPYRLRLTAGSGASCQALRAGLGGEARLRLADPAEPAVVEDATFQAELWPLAERVCAAEGLPPR